MIVALRDRAEEVRQAELDRFRARLDGLDAAQLEAVEALTRGIIGKLLHEPSVALKDAAGSPAGRPPHRVAARALRPRGRRRRGRGSESVDRRSEYAAP